MNKDSQHFLYNLLKGCLKNDRKCQRSLYEHFYSYGMSISLRYSDNREEAVELLNEAFMKAFTNLKKFDLTKPFKPWFRTILINTCINNFKKKKSSISMELDEAKNHSTPDEILSGISYREILDMIRKLSPAYRTAFNLYVIEGYKHEEIAGMLNISVGASKSNLFKAKKHMQWILKDYFMEDNERIRQG